MCVLVRDRAHPAQDIKDGKWARGIVDALGDLLEVLGVSLAQFFTGDGVVVHFGGARCGRFVNVPTQPDGLDDDADVLVVF